MVTPIQQTRRRGGEPHHAILFADMCGFTEYTCVYGDEMAARLALSFHNHARQLAAREGCRVVKSIGDAVMVHSTHCLRALRLAQGMLDWGEREGRPAVRVGLDVGAAVEHEGDLYGSTVNTAARLAGTARAGEIVITERVRGVIPGSARLETVGLGIRHLKGLPELRLHAAGSGLHDSLRGEARRAVALA